MTIQTQPRPKTSTAFRLFPVEVTGVRRLGTNLARITFGGAELGAMATGGLDQRIKLVFPLPGQDLVLPGGEQPFQALRALPDGLRPHLRTYTLRAHRPEQREFDVDFVLHATSVPARRSACAPASATASRCTRRTPNIRTGGASPAWSTTSTGWGSGPCSWATRRRSRRSRASWRRCRPGCAPRSSPRCPTPATCSRSRPPPMPACSGCRGWAARRPVCSWPTRSGPRPAPGAYCWIAGERDMVTATRRHLLGECGFDRESITFMGYWRRGVRGDLPAN
ncbi:hypothetical protein SACE_3571 [Saccharopolyspora erythraea NRRL 2338]|uniref:Siderophore-interacting protein n=1 Tax=Saccharopolyspora erythraea (strain ATCC 11635 / DSM 40517 / JCM 4748 / NBRC 13426 / NCIMB 8594 / NRRL 2338) TaxID=405948 RepID=A4FFM0_SACEN|nr:hypothetical protein SACE_3571 [Saccharopolyspora erythraea NRRL 2338]